MADGELAHDPDVVQNGRVLGEELLGREGLEAERHPGVPEIRSNVADRPVLGVLGGDRAVRDQLGGQEVLARLLILGQGRAGRDGLLIPEQFHAGRDGLVGGRRLHVLPAAFLA